MILRGWRDDDGRVAWRYVRLWAVCEFHTAVMRVQNRYQDARARIAGACNADTWTGVGYGYGAGYVHWRCGKRRGHLANTLVTGHEDGSSGPHRFHNYTWVDGDTGHEGRNGQYAPLDAWKDTSDILPFRKLAGGRKPVQTRRRARQQRKLVEEYRRNRQHGLSETYFGSGIWE